MQDIQNELDRLCATGVKARNAYRALDNLLWLVVNEALAEDSGNYPGMFAKINHLVQEHSMGSDLSSRINAVRVRLRNLADYDDSQLELLLHRDVMAVKEFEERTRMKDEGLGCRVESVGLRDEERELRDDNLHRLRVVVEDFDEVSINAVADTEGGERIVVGYGPTNNRMKDGWTYLHDILRRGMQLNLVNVVRNEGIYKPELIIVEPDYLVDITSVSACMEYFGCNARLSLINRLKPNTCSEPILIGNLAGQMLDEELHSPGAASYADSLGEFFRHNSMALAAVSPSKDFHPNAMAQQQNIRKILTEDLPGRTKSYDRKNVILEPTFFCEMLGLQGRMDFLQTNYRVLIEQKSGKGAFPPGPDADTPRHQEKHYVQMLLYMAVLHYSFGLKNTDISAFLLYSRYKNGLLGLGPAPELLRCAMQVRNEIAALDMRLPEGAAHVLDSMDADSLNTNNDHSKLWERFTRPELQSLLDTLHSASDAERAYFHRFIQFVSLEHILAKTGNKVKDNSGFAAKWHDSLEKKLQEGNIIIGRLQEDQDFSTMVRFSCDATQGTNFRQGDIVILYPHEKGREPDVRKQMVHRATISEITTEQITLKLRAQQTDKSVFTRHKDKPWAVEHDYIESSLSGQMRGLFGFLSATKSRRDLLLLKRKPQHDDTQCLKGEYGVFNMLSTRVKQAQDFFLIIGPPGTGKTSYGMLNTLKEQLNEEGTSILLTSFTNRAVDEMCSKLTENNLDFVRIGNALSCDSAYTDYLLENRVRECRNLAEVKRLVERTRIFVGTTTSITTSSVLLEMKHFDLAIIDEASQILEPNIIPLLTTKCSADNTESVRKFVMIGDHKQLPAVVSQTQKESAVSDRLLNECGLTDCRLSLFERLLSRYGNDEHVVYMLTKHGRMHPEIAEFPNEAFYDGKLSAVPLPHQQLPTGSRVRFISVAAEHDNEVMEPHSVNTAEAEVIGTEVINIYNKYKDEFDPGKTIGIIVPYRNQISAVRNRIQSMGCEELKDITIDTVERYQGSQRDVIIYGFTISHRYQLDFLTSTSFEENGHTIDRKLNVAMTRARKELILVGNPDILKLNPVFSKLIEKCTK